MDAPNTGHPLRKTLQLLVLATCTAMLLACGTADEEGFSEPREGVWLGGPPTTQELNEFYDKGVRKVIDLRSADEIDIDLAQTAVEASGMDFQHVPVGGDLASEQVVMAVGNAIEEAREAGHGILVHCASGNRAGEVWALYQVMFQGEDVPSALADAVAAGTHGERHERLRAHLAMIAEQGEIGDAEIPSDYDPEDPPEPAEPADEEQPLEADGVELDAPPEDLLD